jgi:hypothetical protein
VLSVAQIQISDFHDWTECGGSHPCNWVQILPELKKVPIANGQRSLEQFAREKLKPPKGEFTRKANIWTARRLD